MLAFVSNRKAGMARLGSLVLLSIFFGHAAAWAQGDTLYGALVMASNVEHPAEAPLEIRSELEDLRAVFGYNEFIILGQKQKPVLDGTEDWLVSSPKFFLRIDTKNPIPGGYAMGLQLFSEKKVIAQARAKLTRENALFIRGPMVAQGQLIILLKIAPPSSAGPNR